MADFFFFTEHTKLNTQLDVQAYGPVKNFENDQYRVTSKITTSSAAKAFAVTGGKILVQTQSNANYVNLLLLPNVMSLTAFTPVLYYIYRGLKKENFIDGSGKIVAFNDALSTDLTNKIWDSFNDQLAHNASLTATEPNVKSIGWNYNVNVASMLISSIFNNPDPDFELFDVEAGDYIGIFEGTTAHPAGFEIFLKDKFYKYTLGDLRADELVIQPAYTIQTGDIEGRLSVQHMYEREAILNFADPAAYFNIFYNIGLKSTSGTSTADFVGILIAQNLTNKFFTSKTVYIDIRNENGYSLNYYKDYIL